ncbi:ABC transporter permease subunit [Thiomicrospira sp. R3]|uniref:ABC transporter permease n=1 Tax=Thiomicrospira sp. R3 TaxID=3035472 RepID=UPI00259B61A9|nr:ABC transporter permease subunit [Thiomicrospira sp. R3]WFE69685.1 ABC transporter permease subunit [Thiomicrospira sp. R3]
MEFLIKILKDFPLYVWSGWAALASLFFLLAAWDFGSQLYGSLTLPSPKETFVALWQLSLQSDFWQALNTTFQRALYGLFISVLFGSLLGMLAGAFVSTAILSRPLVTIVMGTPAIAWIVLAMIWFGMSDQSVIFTVVLAALPIVFIGALQGMRTLEGQYNEMAKSFKVPIWQRITDVYFPHVLSYLFPAWIGALGMSWKIVIMAELLSTQDGMGGALAVARSHFDSALAMALIISMVLLLLIIEYVFFEPIKREVESWRS